MVKLAIPFQLYLLFSLLLSVAEEVKGDTKSERGTSVNMAYGVLQGIPTTDNPAYAQVHR